MSAETTHQDLLGELAELPGDAVEITIWREDTPDELPWLCHVNAGENQFGEGSGRTMQEAVEQALTDYREASPSS